MLLRPLPLAALFFVLGLALAACRPAPPSVGAAGAAPPADYDWPVYLGDKASTQYAPLDDIDRTNVHRLEVAWTYRTGDVWDPQRAQIQTNPLVVDGVLYGASPRVTVFALDAATGRERWRFDPAGDPAGDLSFLAVNRGLVYWRDGDDRRILFTRGPWLHAVDAETGRPIPSFGEGGRVDLKDGLGRDVDSLFVAATTPGVVYDDLLIQGMRVSEGNDAAPGHIRAFDVRTGRIVWTFRTIPYPGEAGYETWPEDAWTRIGGANAWSGLSLDEARGIVYIPTGSASFDFWGGNRLGQNLYANSLLALDARTGERIWHYQTVHHDIWDRDLPAPPNLLTVTHDGRRIDAVAQITKSGWVFVFDRETGEPLFPIEERPVPPSRLRGEVAWPTQPFPLRPAPFARQRFTLDEVTDISPEERAWVLDTLRSMQYGGQFLPFDTMGTVIFPGFDGGGEWGGAAVDPDGVLYVNANEMPWAASLTDVTRRPAASGATLGEQTYATYCAACHGDDLRGDVPNAYPSLLDVHERLSTAQVREIVQQGRGFMPSFGRLSAAEQDALVAFLFGEEEPAAPPKEATDDAPAPDVPYVFDGYHRFVTPAGHPAVKPPWGTLNAIDLNTGEYRWTVRLGELPELTARGIPPTGTENYGGPVVTAGGLIFIAATKDERIRAFDKDTGEELWEAPLPYGGYATPATYQIDGRQYVVVAAGGGKMGTPSGGTYVAFALPEE